MAVCLVEIKNQDYKMQLNGIKKDQYRRIQDVCKDIVRYPSRNWQVEVLADKMHCSPRHFARFFKEFNGLSTQKFIMNARIEIAKGLLHSSDYSVGYIAEAVGYCDICYFSRQFKQKQG